MNYLTVIKDTMKNKDKKTENLILIIIILVVLLIFINFFLKTSESSKNSNNTSSLGNINGSEDTVSVLYEQTDNSEIEKRLEDILSKINGIEDVSVMLTYSTSSKQNVVYNITEETNGENKKSEKTVAYNEKSGQKNVIVESADTPKVEGIIIVAKGANSVEMKSKIASAAAVAVNIPTYKVQVFEK